MTGPTELAVHGIVINTFQDLVTIVQPSHEVANFPVVRNGLEVTEDEVLKSVDIRAVLSCGGQAWGNVASDILHTDSELQLTGIRAAGKVLSRLKGVRIEWDAFDGMS